MNRADGNSGGRGRGAPGWEEVFSPYGGNTTPFSRGERLDLRGQDKFQRRRTGHMSVGHELDHALVIRIVGILVNTVVQRLRGGCGLERDMQPQHQRHGEDSSP